MLGICTFWNVWVSESIIKNYTETVTQFQKYYFKRASTDVQEVTGQARSQLQGKSFRTFLSRQHCIIDWHKELIIYAGNNFLNVVNHGYTYFPFIWAKWIFSFTRCFLSFLRLHKWSKKAMHDESKLLVTFLCIWKFYILKGRRFIFSRWIFSSFHACPQAVLMHLLTEKAESKMLRRNTNRKY